MKLRSVFLSMALVAIMAAVVIAGTHKYYTSSAGTTNVSHNWGFRATTVQIDPFDGSTDVTGTWVSFDGAADSILIPATGLIVPNCDCSRVVVRRSTGNVTYGLWVHK